jgi:aminoglycoside/choline kinase family phosphotransferase
VSRDAAIAAFLAGHGFGTARPEPLVQDASLRHYLRLRGGPCPAVLMDAPPPETIAPFRRVAAHLAALGLSVPEIYAADEATGLMLIEDLGDSTFTVAMTAENQATLFDAAVDALAAMQEAPAPPLPAWNAETMAETALTTLLDWWWPAAFRAPAPDAARRDLAGALRDTLAPLRKTPPVFVHRDYFAGNLMWLPERGGARRVGVLDFQAAALGHPAYDLASLIEDNRREIPGAVAERATARLLALRPSLDPEAFCADVAICAAQRHLRVAGQWVRLARRDCKPHYLAYGPHTWRRLAAALQHPATAPLAAALARWIPPERRGNPPENPGGAV